MTMSGDRYERLSRKRCPTCGAALLPGPVGGAAQNYYCSNRSTCRRGYNLTFWCDELVFEESIGTIDADRFALYVKQH